MCICSILHWQVAAFQQIRLGMGAVHLRECVLPWCLCTVPGNITDRIAMAAAGVWS